MDQLAKRGPIALDDRRLALEEGKKCSGDDPREVEVGRAIDVGRAADGHGEVIGLGEGAGEKVCAGLGDGVGGGSQQWGVLGVREGNVSPVRFVARSDEDSSRDSRQATRFKKEVGPPDIALESGQGGVGRRSNDRLGGKVKDGVDPELSQDVFEQR